MSNARVILWGRDIGAVSWLADSEVGVFQYTPDFARSAVEVSPLMMPLSPDPYSFPALSRDTFKGLPGLLADALPDRFGNALIDAWLASRGRTPESFNSVERLCYVGRRGIGALEFEPVIGDGPRSSRTIEIESLVGLANRVLDERADLGGVFTGEDDQQVIEDILRVGTSAGGARAKAVLAWNPETGEFRSGQIEAGAGFEHWLMKFDGITNNRDRELADPRGYGLIEFAYSRMAVEAGIEMAECRLHREGGRSHFMTRRFDRDGAGRKLHMQSLGALRHFDFNQPGAYSYEQVMQVIRQLGLAQPELEQQLCRTVFNVVARNQDDHVKNIAFLMNRQGGWSLSPAFDVTYAWSPAGRWTRRHQMSVNGKRDGFERADLLGLADVAGIKARRANAIVDQVVESVRSWSDFADEAGVGDETAARIARAHRVEL